MRINWPNSEEPRESVTLGSFRLQSPSPPQPLVGNSVPAECIWGKLTPGFAGESGKTGARYVSDSCGFSVRWSHLQAGAEIGPAGVRAPHSGALSSPAIPYSAYSTALWSDNSGVPPVRKNRAIQAAATA